MGFWGAPWLRPFGPGKTSRFYTTNRWLAVSDGWWYTSWTLEIFDIGQLDLVAVMDSWVKNRLIVVDRSIFKSQLMGTTEDTQLPIDPRTHPRKSMNWGICCFHISIWYIYIYFAVIFVRLRWKAFFFPMGQCYFSSLRKTGTPHGNFGFLPRQQRHEPSLWWQRPHGLQDTQAEGRSGRSGCGDQGGINRIWAWKLRFPGVQHGIYRMKNGDSTWNLRMKDDERWLLGIFEHDLRQP